MQSFQSSRPFQREVSDFGRATQSKREPAAVADADISETVADFDKPASVFEHGDASVREQIPARAINFCSRSTLIKPSRKSLFCRQDSADNFSKVATRSKSSVGARAKLLIALPRSPRCDNEVPNKFEGRAEVRAD